MTTNPLASASLGLTQLKRAVGLREKMDRLQAELDRLLNVGSQSRKRTFAEKEQTDTENHRKGPRPPPNGRCLAISIV
jgi:hypothetical protein